MNLIRKDLLYKITFYKKIYGKKNLVYEENDMFFFLAYTSKYNRAITSDWVGGRTSIILVQKSYPL